MTRGLGSEDPFSRRDVAAQAFIPKGRPVEDDEGPDQRILNDSTVASNYASIDGEGKEENVPVVVSDPAPPPASSEPVGRTQMNARVLTDRFRVLKRYQRAHGATLQAVVDQMVDEYLRRRGLWPPSDS